MTNLRTSALRTSALLLVTALVGGSLCLLAPVAAVAAPAADDWPMFHRNDRHTGVSLETTLSATNAASINLQWQVNTGDPTYTSPAVAFNQTLGRTLVYQGNKAGVMAAHDAMTGERVWAFKSGAYINASPAKAGNSLYFGSADERFYALDATTGAVQCSYAVGGVISSSPVVADPDGTGPVVYFGDNGLAGGDDGGHVWAVNGVHRNAAPDCSPKWMYDDFGDPPGSQPDVGSWSPPAFIRDANGRPLIVAGGSSPENALYAFDAVTGERAWRFQTEVIFPDNDVGAAPTVSPPGVNGFASGVVYVTGKNQISYAVNLTTGEKIWEYRIRDDSPDAGGTTRSGAALVAGKLYLGYGSGVYALDARTGAKVWKTEVPAQIEVVSSPAVTGPDGDRVLFVGDLSGRVTALRLSDGADRWSYQTGGFIYGSAAISGGKVFIGSSDGFLYAFGLGGGASAKPSTTITQPADGSTVANPDGSLALSGTASDDTGVQRVHVAIKDKNANKWWDASTSTWVRIFTQHLAELSAPGSTSTTWSSSFPVPRTGAGYLIQADAVDLDGQHSAPVALSNIVASSLGSPPETAITSVEHEQIFRFPDGVRQSFPITIEGSATDSGGPNPGVAKVSIVLRNTDHGEYFCGSEGCGTAEEGDLPYTSTYQKVDAVLASPGATTTTWSITFPTYDHPHKYSIAAWAIDRDGEPDVTKAKVTDICVRDPGVNAC